MDYSKFLQRIFERAISQEASDIHLSVGHPPILRIVRKLVDLTGEKIITLNDAKEIARSLIAKEHYQDFLKNKEIDFAYNFENKARFRASIYFEQGNPSIALRIIPQKIKTIEELNLPLVLNKITEDVRGFVLITGASSQGKSTTLAALVDSINHKRREHIITIEDPIEYVFKEDKCLIDQRELYSDTLSFSKALRSSLREDPDVIVVGEMRDLETISMAITAAETGHLILATLHTNSASQTVHRIIDVFPSYQQNQIRAQLSSSLLAVVSQRLILTKEERLVPACEVAFNNSAVSNLIRENKVHEIPTIIETSSDEGMISFDNSLIELVKQGKISPETAIKTSLNPENIRNRF